MRTKKSTVESVLTRMCQEVEDAAAVRLRLGFGEGLKIVRKMRGKTLREMGKTLGVSAPYLCDVESGNRKPSAKLAKRIREWLSHPDGDE
jgi:DNA-binding XRE family transcriptional regulator